jgi:nitrile hydratase
MADSIDREEYNAARVRALESLLIEKGVITADTVDKVIEFFERDMGPFNGAKIVAKAWVDPAFKTRLLADTPAAIAEMNFPRGMAGAEGENMKAVANTSQVHNLIVCTMCSCYPWPVLGLPPYWFKDPTFRARAIREPRKVLKEFGLSIPESVEVKVWDTSAQIRWFVLPERPEGTDGWTEVQLAAIVTPESMQGAAKVVVSADTKGQGKSE